MHTDHAGCRALAVVLFVAFTTLVAFCIGCVPTERREPFPDAAVEDEHTLHADETFTPSERGAIEEANAFIAEHTHRPAWTIVWDLPHPTGTRVLYHAIVRAPVGDPIRDAWGADWLGITLDRRMIVLEPDAEPFVVVAAHELGHLDGCDHTPAVGPYLMTPSELPDALVWTSEDDEACHVTAPSPVPMASDG